MTMKEKIMALTSSFGKIEAFANYILFTPEEGTTFCPCLVHVNYKDLDEYVFETIKEVLSSDNPPLMLFTYGNSFANVSSLINSWKQEGLHEAINAVVSIHNDQMGIFDGWGTFYDNLPKELEILLDEELNNGKYIGVGNKLAENIGCILNKPVISFNFIGNDNEYDLLNNVINFIPEFPEYDYNKEITNWQPIATREDTCYCCSKRRGPLKFFYRLQGFLCPVCEKKVKAKGVVNLKNFLEVGAELQQQRSDTRRSNLRQVLNKHKHTCLSCGGELTYVDHHKYVCGCKKIWWIKQSMMYEIRRELNKDFVYTYSIRNTGYIKLIRTQPVTSYSAITWCDICQTMGISNTSIHQGRESYNLCPECFKKYKDKEQSCIERAIEEKQRYMNETTKHWR